MPSGIASSQIKRDIALDIEKTKVLADHRHPMYNITPENFQLKSRKSFLKTSRLNEGEARPGKNKMMEATH